MRSKLKQDIFNARYAILIIIIYCVFAQTIWGDVCWFKIVTNIPCPACGLTRASVSLLRGDISKTIEYNSSVFLWWITIILFFIDRYIHKIKGYIICPIITCLYTIIIYIIKIFF